MGDPTAIVLIVSNRDDATAAFLESRLTSRGVQFVRMNTEHLGSRTIRLRTDPTYQFEAQIHDRWWGPTDFSAVYYRRPVAPVVTGCANAEEAHWVQSEVRNLWGGFLASIPFSRWLNHPVWITQAAYKPEQLSRANTVGLKTPESLVTNCPLEAKAFCDRLGWDVIAKPIGHGEIRTAAGSTSGLIYTNKLSPEHANDLGKIWHCPVLLQELVPKAFDVRVTVIDEDVHAVRIHSQSRLGSEVDFRRENMVGMEYSRTELPQETVSLLRNLTRDYKLRYAAIDVVETPTGEYVFLELNPSGQWAWLEEEVDVPISESFQRLFLRMAKGIEEEK